MKILSLVVAAAALVCLAAAMVAGGGPIFGVSASPTLVGVAFAGALLSFATARAAAISTFLRIFSTIFAVEYVVTSLAFAASATGVWPAALAGLTPPSSLAITLAVFGMIVFAISFIPVVRQITGLADAFFEARETRVLEMGWLGTRTVSESGLGRVLLTALVVLNQVQVAIMVRLNFFNRDWFDAIQRKDAVAFWSLLFTVFFVWALVYIASNLIEYFFQSVLYIRWRSWLTRTYSARWLDEGGLYRMGLMGDGADNPDQRIAEDVKNFILSTYSYSITLLSQISTLVSFSLILWTIPAEFVLPGTDIVVPGLPFWVAVLYSVFGTWITHLIGRKLVGLEFRQERFEADFRFSLARLREYGEQVALLRGETAEKQILRSRFADLVVNYFRIVRRTLKLYTFTSFYGQISPLLPYIIIAPYYFAEKVTLGQMQQTAGAFGRVADALAFFVDRYRSLAQYKAIVDRLTTFSQAAAAARGLGRTPPRIERSEAAGADLEIAGLSLRLPDGRTIVAADDLALQAGRATLVTGPSGSGKSTLFRAIAGVWPFGEGRIAMPSGARVMLLPQRPYVPNGALRVAVTYPATDGTYDDAVIAQALRDAELGAFADQLDREDTWGQRLSGGEQQRLSIARALLDRPDWLFLDEATSALDERLEARMYAILAEKLPQTTIVSIGHRSTLVGMHAARVHMEPREDGVFMPVVEKERSEG